MWGVIEHVAVWVAVGFALGALNGIADALRGIARALNRRK